MNVKHRRLLALGLTVAFVATVGGVHYALAVNPDQTGLGATAKAAGVTSPKSITQIVGQLIKTALSLIGALTLVLIIYAGFLWMTSQGEVEKTKKAKGILGNAVIGLIIIFGAYSLTDYIFKSVITATMENTGGTGSAEIDQCLAACADGSITVDPNLGKTCEQSCRGQ
jgi:hypothetical protein